MAKVFAGFEAVEELFRSGAKSVWSARRPGENTANYAMKLVEPSPEWSPETAREEINHFIERAQVQRTAATLEKGKHWAVVYELAKADGGETAGLITDLYRGSLQTKVIPYGSASRDAAFLHNIIRSVVIGLQELDQACHRPHGALRPSAILVGGGVNLAKSKIVLSSPALASKVANATAQHDFRKLGELLFQLVKRKEYSHDALPLAADEDWLRLGRKGKRWCALCSDLLDPRAASAPKDLAELRSRVRAVKPGIRKRPLIIAASVVLVIGAVAFGVLSKLPPSTGEQYASLCKQYDEWVWNFAVVMQSENLPDSPELKEIIKSAISLEILPDGSADDQALSDPQVISGQQFAFGNDRIDRYIDESRKRVANDPRAKGRIEAANKNVLELQDAINKHLSPDKDLQNLLGALEYFKKNDLPLSKEDKAAFAKVEFNNSSFSVSRLERLVKLRPVLSDRTAQASACAEKVRTVISQTMQTKESDLKHFQELAEARVQAADSLEKLEESLKHVQGLAGELEIAIAKWKIMDDEKPPSFPLKDAKEQSVRDWINSVTKPLDEQVVKQWIDGFVQPQRELASYDPDLNEAAAEHQADVKAIRDAITKFHDAIAALGTESAKHSQAYHGVLVDKWETQRKQFAPIQERMKKLRDDMLDRNLPTKTLALNSNALKDIWKEHQAPAKLEFDRLTEGSPERREVLKRLQKLERELWRLDKLTKHHLPDVKYDWAAALSQKFEDAREDLFKQRDQLGENGVTSAVNALFESAKQVQQDTGKIEEGLKNLFNTLDVKAEATQVAALQQSLSNIVANRNDTLTRAVSGVLDRCTQVIAAHADSNLLANEKLAVGPPEVLWARWHRVIRGPRPGNAAQLARVNSIRVALKKPELQARLSREYVTLAGECVMAALSSKERQEALMAFNSGPGALGPDEKFLSERPRFSLQLARLINDLSRSDITDEDAVAAFTQFHGQVSREYKTPEIGNKLGGFGGLLQRAQKQQKASSEKAGADDPGPPGWTRVPPKQDNPEAESFDLFSPDRTLKLTFIRVSPTGASQAHFVCATEVTVQLFAYVVQRPAYAAELKPLMKESNAGMKTWSWPGGPFGLAQEWFANPFDNQEDKMYARLERLAVPSPPGRAHPMNNIPSAAAKRFAELMGCRLPTQAMWLEAYTLGGDANKNIRDLSWFKVVANLEDNREGALNKVSAGYAAAEITVESARAMAKQQGGYNDGVYWLRAAPADAQGKFHDLVGNVAEWVVTSEGKYGLMGLSALRPADEKPNEVIKPKPRGFTCLADVGFRLAISESVPRLAKELRDELAKQFISEPTTPLGAASQ